MGAPKAACMQQRQELAGPGAPHLGQHCSCCMQVMMSYGVQLSDYAWLVITRQVSSPQGQLPRLLI